VTDDPKRNFQEGASSLDSKKTGVHRHGRNVSEPKSFGVRYMKKTMHSWDAVKIHDAGHSIRYRNRGCAGPEVLQLSPSLILSQSPMLKSL
jgi:hypothetical protein